MKSYSIPADPRQIHDILNEYVIGQEYAKRVLAVAICNHFLRCRLSRQSEGYPVRKSNILLVGSSGTGKTLLAQTMADHLDLPFIVVDATTLSDPAAGARSPENMIEQLYYRVGEDIETTEQGIVFIDEIDKIKRREYNGRAMGEPVQQGLLKLLEGCRIQVSRERDPSAIVDVSQILFICAGTFIGLEDIIRERLKYERWVERDTLLMKTEPEDLVQYGMIPELVSRIPLIAPLHDLSENDLYRIITEPKDSLLKEYTAIFNEYGTSLEFSQDALLKIAREALKIGSGARALRTILEITLLNFMYTRNEGGDLLEISSDIVQKEVQRERKKDELKIQLKNTKESLQLCKNEIELLGTKTPPQLINKMKGLEAKLLELNSRLKDFT